MQTIVLTGKKELDIYINPQRQRLLRLLTVQGAPMTPKRLSVLLGISPSAVQHHLQKLLELGVVGLDHTEPVRGITARYYRALPVTVHIGCQSGDEHQAQRLALIQNALGEVFNGFADALRRTVGRPGGNLAQDSPAQQSGVEGADQPVVSASSAFFGAAASAVSGPETASVKTEEGPMPLGPPFSPAASGAAGQAASAAPAGQPSLSQPLGKPLPSSLSDAPLPGGLPGDVLWGITHLNREDALSLMESIRAFLATHEQPEPCTEPWEYALIAYRATEAERA